MGFRNEETRRGFLASPKHAAMLRAIFFKDVFIPKQRALNIKVRLKTKNLRADINALIDSGATENFISPVIVTRFRLQTTKLKHPRIIRNVDGSMNSIGSIISTVTLLVHDGAEKHNQRFFIIELGGDDIVLGYPFLAAINPRINWAEGIYPGEVTLSTYNTRQWTPDCQRKTQDMITQEIKPVKTWGRFNLTILKVNLNPLS